MKDPDYRIPDDMAAEVLAESARLYAEANKGYSFADLQQACADIQIPPHIVKQAISNVEEKRSIKQLKHQQFRDYLKTQIKKGTFIGVALLVPAIAVASIVVFGHQLKPTIGKMINYLNPQPSKATSRFEVLTVEKGKLKYLTNPKGLSISVSKLDSGMINAAIGMDGYSDLEICPDSNDKPDLDSCLIGKLGGSYEYQGIYNYRIKITGINYDSVVFQIEQISNEPKSALSRSQEEVKQLKKERKDSHVQVKELQEKSQTQIKELQEKSQIQIKELQYDIEGFREREKKSHPPL